jgi:hypothetical protein
LQKWHISPTGALPVNTSTVLSNPSTAPIPLPAAFGGKAKIFSLSSGHKVFAYVAGGADGGNEFTTYDLSSGNIYFYRTPYISPFYISYQTISGFEYLPSDGGSDLFCFSYVDNHALTGGLAYAIPQTGTSGSTVTVNPVTHPSTAAYDLCDLELDASGMQHSIILSA